MEYFWQSNIFCWRQLLVELCWWCCCRVNADHDMLTRLQQELNTRFLQDRGLLPGNSAVTSSPLTVHSDMHQRHHLHHHTLDSANTSVSRHMCSCHYAQRWLNMSRSSAADQLLMKTTRTWSVLCLYIVKLNFTQMYNRGRFLSNNRRAASYFVILRSELRYRDWSSARRVMCKNIQYCPGNMM